LRGDIHIQPSDVEANGGIRGDADQESGKIENRGILDRQKKDIPNDAEDVCCKDVLENVQN
jgi:hypothetical protein